MLRNKIAKIVLTGMAAAMWVGAAQANNDYLMAQGDVASPSKAKALPAPSDNHQVYAQVDFGYSHVAWNNFPLTSSENMTGADDGGFAYGIVGGFKFSSLLGVEGGWIHLPSTDYTYAGSSHTVSSYLMYGAASLSVAYGAFSSVYGLVGLGYRNLSNTASFGGGSNADLVFGFGAKYALFSSVNLGFKYLHQGGTFSGDSQSRLPNANLFMATAGYAFSI